MKRFNELRNIVEIIEAKILELKMKIDNTLTLIYNIFCNNYIKIFPIALGSSLIGGVNIMALGLASSAVHILLNETFGTLRYH